MQSITSSRFSPAIDATWGRKDRNCNVRFGIISNRGLPGFGVLFGSIVWAANATEPDPMAIFHTRVWTSQLDDWTQKTQQIHAIEHNLAGILVKTPYVLFLSHPGINVVTAGELAGEVVILVKDLLRPLPRFRTW